ncbi:MAG: poly-gamma-glutamate biosynthesis protein PgsC [Candidatus Caldatribacteriota bacterium]
MIYQSIGIGIIVSFIFYEIVGLSPGGIVVPGYIALFLDKPASLLVTLIATLLTYFIVTQLANYIILYGRRRFLLMVLTGFLLKWLIEDLIINLPLSGIELQSIGYIIPGLIANEMKRQGILPTLGCLAIVAIMVRLILLLLLKT